MNINPLMQTLEQKLGVPVFPTVADSETVLSEYIDYEYLDERVLVYSDDVDTYDVTNLRVRWYSHSDPQPRKKKLRRALRGIGGVIVDTDEEKDNSTNLICVLVDVDFYSEVDDAHEEEN